MVSSQTLANIGFFTSVDPEFLLEIAKIGKLMKYKKGEVLFKQEAYAKSLSVIAGGKLELTIQFREHLIDTLGPYMRGELIGWSALVKPHIYTMGARAVENSEVICFNGKELLALMDKDKDNGYVMMRKLTELIGERLVNSSIQLMSMRA